MQEETKRQQWRAVDVQKPAASIGPALRAIAGAPGKEAADIRAALSGGSGAAGAYTLPNEMHDEFVAMVSRGMSAVQAGARVIQLDGDDLTIPRVLTGVTPGWRLEGGAVPESDPTFEAGVLTPRSLSLMVKISRELLADGFEIERVLTETIGAGVAAELDRITYRGTGTAPQPLGLFGRTLVPMPGEPLATLNSWRPLSEALASLQWTRPQPVKANALISSGVVLADLEQLTGSYGDLLEPPKSVAALRHIPSRGIEPAAGDENGCWAAAIGDFSQLIFGWRGSISIEPLRERYADTGQAAFLVHARVGIELLNQWAFVVLRRLKRSNLVA